MCQEFGQLMAEFKDTFMSQYSKQTVGGSKTIGAMNNAPHPLVRVTNKLCWNSGSTLFSLIRYQLACEISMASFCSRRPAQSREVNDIDGWEA